MFEKFVRILASQVLPKRGRSSFTELFSASILAAVLVATGCASSSVASKSTTPLPSQMKNTEIVQGQSGSPSRPQVRGRRAQGQRIATSTAVENTADGAILKREIASKAIQNHPDLPERLDSLLSMMTGGPDSTETISGSSVEFYTPTVRDNHASASVLVTDLSKQHLQRAAKELRTARAVSGKVQSGNSNDSSKSIIVLSSGGDVTVKGPSGRQKEQQVQIDVYAAEVPSTTVIKVQSYDRPVSNFFGIDRSYYVKSGLAGRAPPVDVVVAHGLKKLTVEGPNDRAHQSVQVNVRKNSSPSTYTPSYTPTRYSRPSYSTRSYSIPSYSRTVI